MKTDTGHPFARILGRAPRCNVRGRITDRFDAFVETFGPPEVLKWKYYKLVFWNFKRQDGAIGFSLLVAFSNNERPKRGLIGVDVSSIDLRDFEAFMSWALDRIGSAMNGEDAPKFLNGADFVIVPA